MQLTSSFFPLAGSLPPLFTAAELYITHRGKCSRAVWTAFLRPRRNNWSLTPGHLGIDEGLGIKTDRQMGVANRCRLLKKLKESEKKRGNTDVEKKTLRGRGGWSVAFNLKVFLFLLLPITPFLSVSSSFHFLPHFLSYFTVSALLLWQPLPPSAEEEGIPEVKRKWQPRSRNGEHGTRTNRSIPWF